MAALGELGTARRLFFIVIAANTFARSQNNAPAPPTPPAWARLGFESAAAVPVANSGDVATSSTPVGSTPTAPLKPEERRGQFVAAPIPISSPFLGSGLGLITAYILRLNPRDEVSPPSVFGAGGLYTNSSTWAAAGAAKLYFNRDRYRTTIAAGKGVFNYDLYGVGHLAGQLGLFIPIHQTGSALFFESLRRLPKNFFVGPRYQIRSLTLKTKSGGTLAPSAIQLPEIGGRQQTAALGLAIENDSRNSQFYPTRGGRLNFTADLFRKGVGSDRNYTRYQLEFHRNPSLSPRQVLAYRFYACAVNGPVPIYDLCLYGLANDIRGYTTGRYRDRRMFAGQAEYRLELPKRFGVVAFAGAGGVAPTIAAFRGDSLLPAGGAGVRFKLDKKNHINFRLDYAVGKEGKAYYIGVGEAF
jgi:hypothetical protein